MKLRRRIIDVFWLVSWLGFTAVFGQGAPAMEVASIKLAPPNRVGGARGVTPAGKFWLRGITLKGLVGFAYADQVGTWAEVSGGPDWVDQTRYDVEGQASDGLTVAQAREILRHLIAERFGAKVRVETKEAPIFRLVLKRSDGSLGPGVKPWDGKCNGQEPSEPANPKVARCDAFIRRGLTIQGGTMAVLADNLSGMAAGLERAVLDQTGLAGEYNIQFNFEFNPIGPQGQRDPVDPQAQSIFDAIEEQLGLKLQSARGMVPYLVIEQAHPPTEN